MNEGRLFLYWSPQVALPFLFLVMMVTSLLVHASLLYNTTWFSAFWQGGAPVVAMAPVVAAPVVTAAPVGETAAPAMDTAAPAANAAQ